MIIRQDTYIPILDIALAGVDLVSRECANYLYCEIVYQMSHEPDPESIFQSYIEPLLDRVNYII